MASESHHLGASVRYETPQSELTYYAPFCGERLFARKPKKTPRVAY